MPVFHRHSKMITAIALVTSAWEIEFTFIYLQSDI